MTTSRLCSGIQDPTAIAVAVSLGALAGYIAHAVTKPFPATWIYESPPVTGGLMRYIKGHVADLSGGKNGNAYDWHRVQLADPKRCGRFFAHRLFNVRRVIVLNRFDCYYFMVDGAKNYVKGPGYAAIGSIVGNGLVSMVEDEEHSVHRKEISPAFSPAALKTIANVTVGNHALKMIQELEAIAAKEHPNNVVGPRTLMSKVTLAVVAEASFKADVNTVAKAFQMIMTKLHAWMFLPLYRKLPTPSNMSLWKEQRILDELVKSIVAATEKENASTSREGVVGSGGGGGSTIKHLADGEGKTLIDYLVNSTRLTPKDVSAHSLTFMFAGHETSSTALTFLMYVLARFPTVQEHLYEELCSVMSKSSFCELDGLKGCSYLHSVVKEVLRLYPPASQFSRDSVEDDALPYSGTYIPKNVSVVVPVYFIHRDPEIWGDDAEEFKPERWENDPLLEERVGPSGYLPFGLGRRNCIGKDFAMNEIVLITAALCRNFKLVWPEGQPDILLGHAIVLAPKKPFKLEVYSRD